MNWQHSSGREEPVRPHQLSLRPSFLPAQHNTKPGGASGTGTGAHQNRAGRPHHEARDESLYTCPPSQSGGFVDRLHTNTHAHTNTGGSFNTAGAIRVSPEAAEEAGRAGALPPKRFGLLCAPPGRWTPVAVYPSRRRIFEEPSGCCGGKNPGASWSEGGEGRKFTGFLKWLRMDSACHVTRGAVR